MAYKHGERSQMMLFPQSIDEYVSPDDPVRAYDAFIDTLNFTDLGIELDEHKVGNAAYDPRAMLKLLIYGYSYGWRSSRKLERAINHNVSFMWLMGCLKPDHKTISEFRRRNKKAIKHVLKQCVRLCIRLDLIDGNTLFADGTKIRANAGRSKNHTQKHYEKTLTALDKRIDALLAECDRVDTEESSQDSLIKMKKELRNSEQLRSTIKSILNEFEEQGATTTHGKERSINRTDPDSALMRSVQGSHASYNVQSVVDEKHGLIVNTDVVQDSSDVNQFADQIIQAEEVTEKQCSVACADAGYADTEELEKIDGTGTKVVVPSQRQALHAEEKPFSKSSFTYDKEQNCYYCPEGKKLTYRGLATKDGKKLSYRIISSHTCKQCVHFGVCTSAKNGRKIIRLRHEELKEKLERQYEEPESQAIYATRKARVEHPFGHMKHNLGMKNFLLRGQDGAQAETAIGATCFNVVRMITIFGGVQAYVAAMQA